MTAYEAATFTAQELNKIRMLETGLKTGSVKPEDIPAETLAHLTDKNKANLVKANKAASEQLYNELQDWYK